MHVQEHPSAQAFLAATESLRAQQPVLTNVMGTVATGVAAGRVYERERWLTVHDDTGIVGCAVRTAPWPAALSPMPVDAATAIGHFLAEHEPDVTVITGQSDVAHAAAAATGRPGELRMRDIVRVLGTLSDAPDIGGALRGTTDDDIPLLTGWFRAFAHEAGLPVADDDSATIAVRQARIFVWEDAAGVPVAMGGHALPVSTPGGAIGQIGPVYTPREHRRQGYGSAITHSIALRLLKECDTVMLFADAANADSNSIYEQLGFAAVAEIVELELG